ncbi:MAG TPA: TonB-dependent receptor [Allosphingosinicella sp.]|nr:TonB-dependent receptor [Allosphingosinicella sp.]
MKKFGLLGTSALCSFTFVGLSMAIAAPAHAQSTQDENRPNCATLPEGTERDNCLSGEVELESGTSVNEPGASEETILITGSRIRRPNLESTVPITSIGGEQIFEQADLNVGETLNDLPQLRSTFAQSNPGLGIGIAGLNLLDLRGLGTQRTLVLVNGRRHVPADILNNAVSPDVNTIPNDLIERIDIVTGGNSAIYGSDAIAGVVNFVLRRDFEGLQLRGNVNIPEEGFGGQQYVSAMYGMNFADDRGNVTLHGEYFHQERIFASDVPWLRSNDIFATNDLDTGGLAENSDGVADTVFTRDVRSRTIHRFGLVPISFSTAAGGQAPCGRGLVSSNGGPIYTGTPFNCTYIFNPDGTLVQQTGTVVSTGPLGTAIGGNGQTGREGQLLSVTPFLERINFNLLSHFTVSDALELFVEAKWNRVDAQGNNAGPSFIQGVQTQFDFRERPRLDNPFLSPEARTTLTNLILASGCNSNLTGCAPLTAATRAAAEAGTLRFTVARHLADVGLRDEDFRRDTMRVVGGIRGNFWDDWSYELSANYGKFEEDITTDGFIDRQRFVLAMDAGRNPATGQIQCRSQFDPAAAIPIQRTDAVSQAIAAENAARLAADIAACVPYNPFGQADNSASIDYFSRTFTASSSLEQFIVSGFVSGDTSSFFNLWGEPIRFALGAEYREEKAFYEQDDFVTRGFTNGVSIPTFAPDPFEVKEAFGEIQIPLLRDVPFFRELTVSAAARVADYSGSVGTVWSYNAGADWSPVRDLRFRGNYSRAVRAPNVSETAFPLVPNFAPGFTDPCTPSQINSGNNRAARCAEDLGALLGGLQNKTYSLPIVSGSNPNLQEETSDSWTFGVVAQPRFIPGLSISADYYDITVNNIIASVGAQGIVNACYAQSSLENVFCQQFERWRGPGQGPNGEDPGDILGNTLINAPLNYASRVRRGIDFQVAYRLRLDDETSLNTNLIYTHNIQISNYQNALDPTFEDRVLGELGDPVDEFRFDADLRHGPFTFGYRMHYIGSMWTASYESFNSLNGLPPGNSDAVDVRKYPAVTYHDIRFQWDLEGGNSLLSGITPGESSLRFYFGVDNLFNRLPPFALTATGAGSAIYEFRGRTYYAGFRARF